MKIYECEHCEIIFANASDIESNGVCVCGGKTKPRPDLQLVPVGKSCEGCSHRYTIMGCQEERNEIEDICLLTGESNPTKRCENYALKLKKQKAEPEQQTEPINNMMFFTTEWAKIVTKHEQQITAINTRLDRLFEINRNATALLEANLNDSEAGVKKHIELMRKHVEIEKRILDGKEDERGEQ